MKDLVRSLYFQVVFAIVLGVLLGVVDPRLGAKMRPLGEGFIKLIKMLIAPVIFARWRWPSACSWSMCCARAAE